jgi:aspartokinase
MISVASAVEQIVSHSDFALEGLQTGCLNMSAYADSIQQEVEQVTRKSVERGSVIIAVSRLARTYQRSAPKADLFQLFNLVSRTNLTELTYPKTRQTQTKIAALYALEQVQNAQFFVSTAGLNEISVVTTSDLAATIRDAMQGQSSTLDLSELASLTMQVGIETVDTPRQSYTIIKQLALRDINIVEYITSPSELTIILYERDLKNSFSILYDKFFSS